MKIIYILLAFLYVILSSLYTVIIKGIKINSFISFFIVTITIFTIISITNFIDYYKNPKKYNKSTNVKNILGFDQNPFKNIITNSYSWKIGISGALVILILYFGLKKLPLSLISPINLSWLFFSLMLSTIINKVPLKAINVISIIVLTIGVLVCSIHHFYQSSENNLGLHFMIILVLLLLLSNFCKSYQITESKKIENIIKPEETLLLDYGIRSIIGILVLIIYLIKPFKMWEVEVPDISDVGKLILLTSIFVLTYQYLRFKSIENLSQQTFTLIGGTMVVFSIIWGIIFFGESLKKNQIIGIIIIFLALSLKNIVNYFHSYFSKVRQHHLLFAG